MVHARSWAQLPVTNAAQLAGPAASRLPVDVVRVVTVLDWNMFSRSLMVWSDVCSH